MEKLLIKYLKEKFKHDYVDLAYHNVDGAICKIKYYTDESHHYHESANINIWDMLVFLNENINQ